MRGPGVPPSFPRKHSAYLLPRPLGTWLQVQGPVGSQEVQKLQAAPRTRSLTCALQLGCVSSSDLGNLTEISSISVSNRVEMTASFVLLPWPCLRRHRLTVHLRVRSIHCVPGAGNTGPDSKDLLGRQKWIRNIVSCLHREFCLSCL